MHGGLYSPEIAVTAGASDDTIEQPFTMPAVYAAEIFGPSDDTANAYGFHSEVRAKILNLLRFCHEKGHRDLIVTGRFTNSAREVALSFQELLTKSGEVEGRFHRVVFAIPQDDGTDINDDISFHAFWEVFHAQAPCRLMQEGQYMFESVANGTQLCVDGDA